MFLTLISAKQLHQLMHQTSVVIVDCRHDLMDTMAGQRAYDEGHIPNAVKANLETQLSGEKLSSEGVFLGRHPLPTTENLLHHLRNMGINQDSQVVAYDAHGGMYAARLWWLLRSIGHQAVAVLDGGLSAWNANGFALSTDTQNVKMGNVNVLRSLTKQVDVQQLLINLNELHLTVVDARSPDRFRGENETMDPIGGHIPHAVNRFFKDNLQADGSFKTAQELRTEWTKILSQPENAVMQCGSGVTACHNLLALEIAGLHGAALYPGSWSEWCADGKRPIAVGC